MKNYLYIGLVSVSISYFNVYAEQKIIRDPFYPQYQTSCHEQKNTLFNQIQTWQYKGHIRHNDKNYQQIWLASQNEWLDILGDMDPNILSPWQIHSLLNDKIIFQAMLPQYCQESISWTISLNEP
ncbi:hypothetical protein A9G48_06830 [Gilliamella sp. wkB18]|uniref:hypothetical protein n=1 Tax=Gilliamella sp. wkB18 TaxID=3120260 RepID=UPI0004DD021E|nr:hypothetical protein [Gilliamella apicola]KFA59443.1 hypothetical protein GAPWKB11_0186 [Gilliamella apicola]OCG62970.1 hypothetical protein A9G48_06830 [Gilliamella apicola]